MKTNFLFIILSLLLLSCSKEKREKREEKALHKERENILEVHLSNHRSIKITGIQISIADRYDLEETSNPMNIQDLEPGEKIMVLYNCQGKLPKLTDMAFEFKYQLDSTPVINNFAGVYDGTIHQRGVQYDFYEDTTTFSHIFWTYYY
jgi:hypothetical protein